MRIEKIDKTIEFNIAYDVLDAALHRCLSNTVEGFVNFEREEPTRATIIYVLSQFQLGIFAKIRIDKLDSERTSLSLFELREPFTPKQKQEFFEGEDSIKSKMGRLIIAGLGENQSLSERMKKHYDNVIENLFNQLDRERIWFKEHANNQSRKDISQQELLARNFESWQKQYYDDVYSVFEKRDERRLVIAFNHWEDRFLSFLQEALPRLINSYKTRTSQFIPLSFYGGSLQNFKTVKSDIVEAFLTQCIIDARKGNLDDYYIVPKRHKPTHKISTEKNSNQKRKKSAGNITNIYVSGDVTGSNIVVGDENAITITKSLFKSIYRAIEESYREDAEKTDLVAKLNEIEGEVAKGDDANESFLSRRLRNLKKTAPDIADVALAALTSPSAAVGTIIRKVALKIRSDEKR